MGRMIGPILFGFGGMAILIALGVWQMQRLDWKTAVLADMGARIAAAPVALPDSPDPADNYLSVRTGCGFDGTELFVLTSRRGMGPGYRLIVPCDTGRGRVMVDLGFLPESQRAQARAHGDRIVTGNLIWPDEGRSRFTPDPDPAARLWFVRDLPGMAAFLNTEPVLIVAREVTGGKPPTTLWPVDTSTVPNDHLHYAITWFSMAALWLGMTVYLLWRITRRTD